MKLKAIVKIVCLCERNVLEMGDAMCSIGKTNQGEKEV